MAENQKPEQKTETTKTEPIVTTPSTDAQAAAKAGVTEGEVKALRDDAGLNTLPGHEANVLAWEVSEDGKKFVKESKEAAKQAEADAKKTRESLDKDGLSEPEKKYREALSK
jgi:hypothetical protein